jgi:spermidine/putrescine transport system substrate-binding protein
MGTKRIVFLSLWLLVVLWAIFYKKPEQKNALKISTWSNYYPEETLKKFTEETGIPVELSYISSNEELLAKFRAGATGFDIIQPSDYMVGQMKKMGILLELDPIQLPNLKHLGEYYKQLPYDSGFKYSVPFTWGTTGIAVNTKKVPITHDEVSWKLLFQNPDPHKTSFLDDMREVFTAALLSMNKKITDKNVKDLQEAQSIIAKAKKQILTFTSEPKPLLLKGEVWIAHIYSCDGLQVQKENPDIKYFIPKEGAVLWTDNFAIPKTSQKIREAHIFINYFLDPKNSERVFSQNKLSTPNYTALSQLPPSEKNNPHQYPESKTYEKLFFLNGLEPILTTLNKLWTELKT